MEFVNHQVRCIFQEWEHCRIEQYAKKRDVPESFQPDNIENIRKLERFFRIVFPILKPTMISTAILETMWVWNDYLLPTLVLDIKKYRTIPMAIQYFRGGYGRVELAPMMACIIIAIVPIIILYVACQKYIIEGVIAGAVKG